MNAPLVALSVDQLKNVSLAGTALPIVVGLVMMKFVAKAMVRTIIMLIAVVLGIAVYTQRQEISTCYDKAQTEIEKGASEISCSFFGQDVTLTP